MFFLDIIRKKFLFIFTIIITIPNIVLAQNDYIVKGDLLITTIGGYKQTVRKSRLCGKLPQELYQKTSGVYEGLELTDNEYVALFGEIDGFGVSGTDYVYSREKRKIVHVDEFFNNPDVVGVINATNKLDDFPIICGVRQGKAAPNNSIPVEEKEPCVYCDLPGGSYLNAIYKNDYKSQDALAKKYLSQMNDGHGAEFSVMAGALASAFGDGKQLKKQELTVLEETLAIYLGLYSKYDESCLDPGWFERKFAHTTADDVLYDENFVEMSRLPGETTITVYKLNKEFQEACDGLCDAGGTMAFSAMAGNLDKSTNYELGNVFVGLKSLITKYSCRNPEIKQFEANLRTMYEKEKFLQPDERNTMKNMLYSN